MAKILNPLTTVELMLRKIISTFGKREVEVKSTLIEFTVQS